MFKTPRSTEASRYDAYGTERLNKLTGQKGHMDDFYQDIDSKRASGSETIISPSRRQAES